MSPYFPIYFPFISPLAKDYSEFFSGADPGRPSIPLGSAVKSDSARPAWFFSSIPGCPFSAYSASKIPLYSADLATRLNSLLVAPRLRRRERTGPMSANGAFGYCCDIAISLSIHSSSMYALIRFSQRCFKNSFRDAMERTLFLSTNAIQICARSGFHPEGSGNS